MSLRQCTFYHASKGLILINMLLQHLRYHLFADVYIPPTLQGRAKYESFGKFFTHSCPVYSLTLYRYAFYGTFQSLARPVRLNETLTATRILDVLHLVTATHIVYRFSVFDFGGKLQLVRMFWCVMGVNVRVCYSRPQLFCNRSKTVHALLFYVCMLT